MKKIMKAYRELEREQRLRMIYNVSVGLMIGTGAKSATQFISLVLIAVTFNAVWTVSEMLVKKVFNN